MKTCPRCGTKFVGVCPRCYDLQVPPMPKPKPKDETHELALTIELDREADGRWIAEVPELPGVIVYGSTEREAMAAARALALHVVADRIEHGEEFSQLSRLVFVSA
jgi:predicted RNase H-like HicB family nuclease